MFLPLARKLGIYSVWFVLSLSACTCEGVPKGFFEQPPDRQRAQFAKYDFEAQYKIYICGNQSVEPPEMFLASQFAREGDSIVKPLRQKLEETKKDKDVRDIVRLFRVMTDLKTYNVAADTPLMEELRAKVNAMRDEFWRNIAQGNLAAIVKAGEGKEPSRSS